MAKCVRRQFFLVQLCSIPQVRLVQAILVYSFIRGLTPSIYILIDNAWLGLSGQKYIALGTLDKQVESRSSAAHQV